MGRRQGVLPAWEILAWGGGLSGRGVGLAEGVRFSYLVGVQEYQPLRVIRGEVEQALREKRPPAFDKTVDDYLKRLAQ